jgi:hypothetical protein
LLPVEILTAYKISINSLLDTLERNQLGAYLGTHYCGTPTVADDVTLISNDPYELQSMLDRQNVVVPVFEEKPVIACYVKGVQVTKQSSVPNHIKGFTSIHKCHV